MTVEIRVLEEINELTATAAEAVSALISKTMEEQPRVRMVLTGGTLGIQILRDLAHLGLPMEALDIYWGDERFVDLEDSDRNEAQALEAWPDLSKARLFRFPAVGQTLQGAADQMNEIIENELGPVHSVGAVFDILILGMGPDGHVASLFPGHLQQKAWIVPEPDSPKPPKGRLSFSFEALNRSSHVIFLASGESKAKAVSCVLENEECDLPAAKVSGLSTTTWFLDKELSRAL